MTKIVGFIVVRTPKFNFDAEGRGAFSSPAPRLGSIYYGGVDRMPWFDVDKHYYARILPTEIAKLRRKS